MPKSRRLKDKQGQTQKDQVSTTRKTKEKDTYKKAFTEHESKPRSKKTTEVVQSPMVSATTEQHSKGKSKRSASKASQTKFRGKSYQKDIALAKNLGLHPTQFEGDITVDKIVSAEIERDFDQQEQLQESLDKLFGIDSRELLENNPKIEDLKQLESLLKSPKIDGVAHLLTLLKEAKINDGAQLLTLLQQPKLQNSAQLINLCQAAKLTNGTEL
ncbi:MAG: hypothetical protein WBV73_02315, partial [Phormidium sp.]